MEYNLPIDSVASSSNFLRFFIKKSAFFTLRTLAGKGEIGKLGIRVNSWRVFLGIFSESGSQEDWEKTLQKNRENYEVLKDSFKITDPLLGVIIIQNTNILKLRNEISKDVTRTFQQHRFFQYAAIQEKLLIILSLWGATHDLGYLQGMTEIAAIILLQVFSEKCEDRSSPMFFFNNFEFLEHDTYQIFAKMFELGLGDMFMREKPDLKKRNIFSDFMQEIKNKYTKEDISSNPVVKICHDVFEVYLPIIDMDLFQFLHSNGVEPHLFLL